MLSVHKTFHQEAGDESHNKFTARIKMSAPEQIYSYIVQLVNLLTGILVFTALMATDNYAETMVKVKAASGISMSLLVYIVAPTTLLLSMLAKLLFHAFCETWSSVGVEEKWAKQQFVPRPKSKTKMRKVTILEGETSETPAAEFVEILETIHERKK